MRRVGIGLLLLACLGVVAVLWQEAGRLEPTVRRGPGAVAVPETPPDPEPPASSLAIENGVALAPSFPEDGAPADASGPVRFWVGRAMSTSARRGVAGATVVLESLGEPGGARAQPATTEGGFFTLRASPGPSEELRVVIESPAGEVGVAALVVRDEAVTDVGTVWLAGHGVLDGRVVDERGEPAPDVRLTLRRFGELEALPGTVAGATSDERGAFRLARLPRGSFALAGIGREGRRYLAAPVTVPQTQALVVAPLPAAGLEIEVRNTLHEAVAQARLQAVPLDVDPGKEPLDPALFVSPYLATTDSDGAACFPFLMPRAYALLVTLPDGSLFEFAHPHVREERRRLVVPADPRVRVLLIEAPEAGPVHRPFRPLRRTPVDVTVSGRTSLPERLVERSLSVTTDEEGVAALPRLGSVSLHLGIRATGAGRSGERSLELAPGQPGEGLVAGVVAMRPAPAPEAELELAAQPRRARVTLPSGVPVAGAKVYVRARVETDDAGEADLGPAPDASRARLFRPDLASGDPDAGEFGGRALVELTWNEGEVVTVRVSDALDGFPLADKVRIFPRPSAWRLVEPGLFRSRWDVAYADPEAEIVVRAPGYEDWCAPGGPGELDAALRRPLVPTAILEVEVRSGSTPLPGIRVSGHADPRWPAGAGRREFCALTDAEGRVDVADLAEGPWILRADAEDGRAALRDLALAPGGNPVLLHVGGRPAVSGRVVDDRGRPVVGARIDRVVEEKRHAGNRDLPHGAFDRYPQLPAVRTDRAGAFGLGLPRNGRVYLFEAKAVGHQAQRFEVAGRTRKKPLVVTLPRLVAVALPLEWGDGRVRPVPDGLVCSISRRVSPERWTWADTGITAHVMDGRLCASGLPPGRLRFAPIGGSAWTPAFEVQAAAGAVLERPAVRLRGGGTVEGVVTDDTGPAASILLHVGTRPARTDAQGRFRLTGLPPGNYGIRAEGQTPESIEDNRRVGVSDGFVSRVTVRISRGRRGR